MFAYTYDFIASVRHFSVPKNGVIFTAIFVLSLLQQPSRAELANLRFDNAAVTGNVLINESDPIVSTLSVTKCTIGGVVYFTETTAPAPSIITVTPVNVPPVAVADNKTVVEDKTAKDNVLTNDSDPDADPLSVDKFTVGGVDYPAGTTATLSKVGKIGINANGDYTFIPVANYYGTVPTITVTITDGTDTATAPLTIIVTSVNDRPKAVSDTETILEDSTATGNVLANDIDVDGDSIKVDRFTIIGFGEYLPGNTAIIAGYGTLVVNIDGAYKFIPEPGFSGQTPFIVITITDGTLLAGATLTIIVTPLLPLTWLNFTASLKANKTTLLKWETTSEIGVKDLVIERSFDGTNWKAIGTKLANGSRLVNVYEFIDALPLEGINLYRIKQRSAGGTFSYSVTRTVRLAGDPFSIAAMPNPATRLEKVAIKGNPNHPYQLMLLNAQGQKLMEAKAINGNNSLDLIQFSPGAYIIRVEDKTTGEARGLEIIKE